jgi:Na+-translocating ferredoxin:NAD+ oxidoreductase RnfE subunit
MENKKDYVDIYCERVSGDFLAEPINALTNLAFILVGLFILKGESFSGRILGFVTILVGLGSLAFHTFATTWAATLDVAFIALFILVFAYLVPLKLWNLSITQSIICSTLVIGIVFLFNTFTPELKKWLGHFPPGIYVVKPCMLWTYFECFKNKGSYTVDVFCYLSISIFNFSKGIRFKTLRYFSNRYALAMALT